MLARGGCTIDRLCQRAALRGVTFNTQGTACQLDFIALDADASQVAPGSSLRQDFATDAPVPGNTYLFITRAAPDGTGGTNFSAWFHAPETAALRYIAT